MASPLRVTDAACEGKQHCKITVASLCCDVNEAAGAPTEPTRNCHLSGREFFPVSEPAPIWAHCHRLEHPATSSSTLSSLPVHLQRGNCPGPTPQLRGVDSSDTTNSPGDGCDTIDLTSTTTFRLNNNARDLSTVDTDTSKPSERRWCTAATTTSSSSATRSRSKIILPNHLRSHHRQSSTQAVFVEPVRRKPRPARPSYTEEQRFFIMYYRIVKKLPWSEIEGRFATSFNLRAKDGLTSVYYRVRKIWGMDEVLKAKSSSADDRSKVECRAAQFSKTFLIEIGYLE